MMKQVAVLLLAGAVTVAAQDSQPANPLQYEGYYLLEYQKDNRFENFWQLELQLTQPENASPRLLGRALIHAGSLCDAVLQSFFISVDSLSFVTERCAGESYEFRGRFLGVPFEFEGDHESPVLEGILIHYRDHTVVKESTVRFLYSVGC